MKCVVMWETRQWTSEETQVRGVQVFSKWSPSESTAPDVIGQAAA